MAEGWEKEVGQDSSCKTRVFDPCKLFIALNIAIHHHSRTTFHTVLV